jgi:hypothetical protein
VEHAFATVTFSLAAAFAPPRYSTLTPILRLAQPGCTYLVNCLNICRCNTRGINCFSLPGTLGITQGGP